MLNGTYLHRAKYLSVCFTNRQLFFAYSCSNNVLAGEFTHQFPLPVGPQSERYRVGTELESVLKALEGQKKCNYRLDQEVGID